MDCFLAESSDLLRCYFQLECIFSKESGNLYLLSVEVCNTVRFVNHSTDFSNMKCIFLNSKKELKKDMELLGMSEQQLRS